MSFRLTINGVTKTLAEWRVNGVQLTRRSLEPDIFSFDAPRQSWDEEPLCEYGDEVRVLDAAGDVWFIGTRQLVPQQADPGSQSQSYSFLGPLRWLAENVYQQPWYNGTIYTSHIIASGEIGSTVRRVLDYAIANGAQLTYVAADLTILDAIPPVAEFTEKTCLDVILDTLQFAPDLQAWLDYSTDPLPTFRLQRRDDLAAASLRMPSHDDPAMLKVASARVTARPDRQVPSVKINFERIDDVDGNQFLVPSTDIFPIGATGREDGALNATVTLQGRTQVNVFGELETIAIDYTSADWWKLHYPSLLSDGVLVLGGPFQVKAYDEDGVELDLTTLYPNELPADGGQIAEWMTLANGDPVAWQNVTFKARFYCDEYEIDAETGAPDSIPHKSDWREVTFTIRTTNAPEGVSSYTAIESIDSGDPQLTGLAEFLYTALNPLRYDAAFTLQEQACTGTIDVGNVINLFGSRAAYQAMRASVNEVTFQIDNGITQISCGPARVLGLNQLLALLQRFRVRRSYTNPDTQDTGELGANEGQVNLAKTVGNTNSLPGSSLPSLATTKATIAATGTVPAHVSTIVQNATGKKFLIDFGNGKQVTIDAAAADWISGGELKVKEYGVCVRINGVDTAKKALFIASDYYD